MAFENLMDSAQYRALSNEELELRRQDVAAELENPTSTFTLEQMRSEVSMLKAEDERRKAAMELRMQTRAAVAGGAGSMIATSDQPKNKKRGYVVDRSEEALSSPEYEREFVHYLSTRGAKLSPEFEQYQRRDSGSSAAQAAPRAGVLADAGILVPLTTQQRIIERMEDRGVIWNAVDKTNVPGGIDIPTGEFGMEATWIGEKQVSQYQLLNPVDDPISFRYHQLECRWANTLLAEVISPRIYLDKYAEKAGDAMVDKLELAILSGTGVGQPLGLLVDPRVDQTADVAVADLAGIKPYEKAVKNKIARLASGYRNGKLYMAETTWNYYFEGMSDQTGQPVARVNYGMDGEAVRTFLGQRVEVLDEKYLPYLDDAITDSKTFMLYGDLKDYVVNSNLQMRADRWEDYETNTFKTRLIMIVDGKVVDPFGFVKFNAKAGA